MIKLNKISKKFIVPTHGQFINLRNVISNVFFDIVRKRDCVKSGQREIWALKNINLEIRKGEIVGIIGPNGSGKSTLLKLISKVLIPSSGEICVNGKLSALLEVSAGFHPELTGRENVYMKAAIMGMRKKDIESRFNQIVEFAGVSDYINMPIKKYSSGMKARLGFSVAVHLDSDIILIDEVLSVGDLEFQKESFKKLIELINKTNRTVIIVSHNFNIIKNLCDRCVWLHKGEVVKIGPTSDIINEFYTSTRAKLDILPNSIIKREDRRGGAVFRVSYVDFFDYKTRAKINRIKSGQKVLIKIGYELKGGNAFGNCVLSISFFTQQNQYLFSCRSDTLNQKIIVKPGNGFFVCVINNFSLSFGPYYFNLIAYNGSIIVDFIKEAGYIEVEDIKDGDNKKLPRFNHQGFLVDYKWENI